MGARWADTRPLCATFSPGTAVWTQAPISLFPYPEGREGGGGGKEGAGPETSGVGRRLWIPKNN